MTLLSLLFALSSLLFHLAQNTFGPHQTMRAKIGKYIFGITRRRTQPLDYQKDTPPHYIYLGAEDMRRRLS
jgi:hypothetical protein